MVYTAHRKQMVFGQFTGVQCIAFVFLSIQNCWIRCGGMQPCLDLLETTDGRVAFDFTNQLLHSKLSVCWLKDLCWKRMPRPWPGHANSPGHTKLLDTRWETVGCSLQSQGRMVCKALHSPQYFLMATSGGSLPQRMPFLPAFISPSLSHGCEVQKVAVAKSWSP